MAFQYAQQQQQQGRLRPLVELENEQQARAAGRAFAKQIFGRMQWKRIGSKADESAKLYESVVNGTAASDGRYTVRAVRHVAASISEIEIVLATSARYGALSVLLADSYSSGRVGIEYGQVLHSTGEREHASIEFVSLKPYAGILGMEHHVLLSYSLATVLQRTRKRSSGAVESVSVPSVLHLLRPVESPTLALKRRDYQREYLSLNDWSVTYIVQESTAPGIVTLEVVLTCTDDALLHPTTATARSATNAPRRALSQKQRMWNDALSLTRVEQLVANYRASRGATTTTATSASQSSSAAQSSVKCESQQPSVQHHHQAAPLPGNSSNTSSSDSISTQPTVSHGCSICHKRFGPFRWKRHCQVCAHSACDRCLSVIANPTAVRRKKRVCNNCLYGPNGLGAQHQQAAAVAAVATPAAAQHPESVRQSTATTARASRYATPTTRTTRSGSRAPPPVPEYDRSSKRFANRASRSSSRSEFSDSEDDGNDNGAMPPVRARRAQTVTIDEVTCTPVVERKRSFRMVPSYRSSVEPRDGGVRLTTLLPPASSKDLAGAGSYRTRLQLHQLTTPDADYDLDFDWLNIFPKAPVPRLDAARVQYVNSVLRMDPQSVVFLRHDRELERLAHCVLDVASQWHGCSVNVAGRTHVYCVVNASAELDASTSQQPAVVVDDVMPRHESASSYAVYHNAPFFVAELGSDDRFRAHPLTTDHNAVSFLSFPLYAAAGAARKTQTQCIGTLDLWKLDRVAASSHVSHDWWQRVEALVSQLSARLEALALECSCDSASGAASATKLRGAKAYSVDASSSCDSRGSTRRDDSFELDLFDLDEELTNVSGSPASVGVSEDSVDDAFYTKGRRSSAVSSGYGGGLDARSWRFSSHSSSYTDDSDNESTTSSSSRTSRSSSSRYSQRYSAADLHSAIESLLHQANETSSMVYSTGVQI